MTDHELEAKYPDQLWRALAPLVHPFMVNVIAGPGDTCSACQAFARDMYYSPDHVPVLPLTVCECDDPCPCEVR